jgi:hypothetical protein
LQDHGINRDKNNPGFSFAPKSPELVRRHDEAVAIFERTFVVLAALEEEAPAGSFNNLQADHIERNPMIRHLEGREPVRLD